MSCTCTEDFETIGNVTIGRNKVTCQECNDALVLQAKQREKASLLAQIKDLEGRIYYSQLDGATEFVESKMAQRAALKAALAILTGA